MEFGARAQGNRSIIADPAKIDKCRGLTIKLKIKFFEPFAPSI